MEEQKKYTGTVFITTTGSEVGLGACRDSIDLIQIRQGDTGPYRARATKGYEARQTHINKFIESGQDFILLLDADMYFDPDTLERLRSHELPYVSGVYMRRNWETLGPVWYRKFAGKWPMEPWVGEIENDKLHEIGASGWGCVLIHRDVILAVRELLKGEHEVIEDDMDIYPYDLKQVMRAMNGLEKLAEAHEKIDAPLVKAYVDIFREEIRPLRCDNGVVGSDIRFPFFALLAGYQLMGDPNVKPGHNINFPLNTQMYVDNFTEEEMAIGTAEMRKETIKARATIGRQIAKVKNA